MNKNQAAVCEVELKNGDVCSIPPIGRCTTCGLAFCLTHQGRVRDSFHGWISYVDRCALCSALQQAKEEEREKEARVPYEYFMSGAARTDLLARGVPSVEIYHIGKKWNKKWGLLGRRYEEVDVVFPFARGWILGEFMWNYYKKTPGISEADKVNEKWLTALLDLSSDDPQFVNSYSGTKSTLGRVRPYSGGYELLGVGDQGSQHTGWWIQAMMAVRQLARLST